MPLHEQQPKWEERAEQPTSETDREEERMTLSGRVGADPTFRTTPKGTLVGRFPLAVHDGPNTTWYPILAFNERAEQLRETVTKGQALRVVGYLHQRERRGRDGTVRNVSEIYAVTVTPRDT